METHKAYRYQQDKINETVGRSAPHYPRLKQSHWP